MKNALLGPLVATALAISAGACKPATNIETEQSAQNSSAEASTGNLAGMLADAGSLSTAAGLVKAAGLDAMMAGKAPYTLFLPDDAAFSGLKAAELVRLRSADARPELIALLRRHIVPGVVTRKDLVAAMQANGGKAQLATVAGTPLTMMARGDTIRIGADGPTLAATEYAGTNGVIYQISGLIPPAD